MYTITPKRYAVYVVYLQINKALEREREIICLDTVFNRKHKRTALH